MLSVSRLLVVGLIFFPAAVSHAQAAIELPLIQDRLPLEGYGSSKADVLGIRLGEARADAIALLKKSFPEGKITEFGSQISIGDNRGNKVVVAYPHTVRMRWEGDKVTEDIRILFSSGVTGGRVVEIERELRYKGDELGDMAAIRAGISDKHGESTVVERYDHQNRMEISYTWEKRPVMRFGELDVQKRGFADMGPTSKNFCLLTAGSSAYSSASSKLYSYIPPDGRKGNPGWDVCVGAIKYTIFYGNNARTVRQLNVIATDYERSMIDARLLDRTLTKMVEDKANSVGSTAAPPKL